MTFQNKFLRFCFYIWLIKLWRLAFSFMLSLLWYGIIEISDVTLYTYFEFITEWSKNKNKCKLLKNIHLHGWNEGESLVYEYESIAQTEGTIILKSYTTNDVLRIYSVGR